MFIYEFLSDANFGLVSFTILVYSMIYNSNRIGRLQYFLIGNVLHILRRILSDICSCKQTILAILRKLLDHIVCVKECWAVVFNRIALTATFVATEIPKIAIIAFPEAFFLKKYDDNKHLGVN